MRKTGTLAGATLALIFGISASSAFAETIRQALASAYHHNPTLNAQRASVRATDELVAIAKSGLRPTISGSGSVSKTWRRTGSDFTAGNFGIDISQTIFDGLQTHNNIAGSKAAVRAARETLRNIEQNVLFDAASAYMDVIQSAAIVGFRTQSLAFLDEQVRSENTRFEVGESTRTDVAQAQGRQAAAIAQLSVAQANLKSARAVYRQIIGKQPGKLKRPRGIASLLPKSLDQALSLALKNHPAILARLHVVDQALYDVKSAEGALLPNVTLNGSFDHDTNSLTGNNDSATLSARLNVPIYQGGRVSATVRRGKETLGQRRIQVDETRESVRAAVISAYSQFESSQAALIANNSQLKAARLALQGAVEERKVGQRTTLDVLNTQQEVINAQISLVQSQRNVIVASYAILSAIGSLKTSKLSLKVARYDPEEHYDAVKDKWYGLRTPNGQ